jgi:hypothetical protein
MYTQTAFNSIQMQHLWIRALLRAAADAINVDVMLVITSLA